MSDAERYAWVDDDETLQAACFTVVVGVPEEEVAQRFGGDLSTERRATFADAFNPYPDAQYLVFDPLDDAVLAAENNGWEGSRAEVAEAVSRGGKLGSVYWSVNADMTCVYAVDGVVVAWFDPLLVEQPWEGSDPESVRRVGGDLPFGEETPAAASFALIERLTGARFQRAWLDEPHRCVDVEPLPEI